MKVPRQEKEDSDGEDLPKWQIKHIYWSKKRCPSTLQQLRNLKNMNTPEGCIFYQKVPCAGQGAPVAEFKERESSLSIIT